MSGGSWKQSIVTIFGVHVDESQWKIPLNDRRFINRRNFWNEQELSADVIYNEAAHTHLSTVVFTENQTQRLYLT